MIRSRLKKGIKQGLKKVLRVDISGPAPDYGVDARHRSSTAPPPVPKATAPQQTATSDVDAAVAATEQAAAEAAAEAAAAEAAAAEAAAAEAAAAEAAAAEAAADAATAEASAEPAEAAAEAAPSTMDASDDTAGEPMTMEAVQEILDDMVRPALQGDGGDIALLKIEDDNIYVRLVGSCSSCPSSIMTMKMGVEALLKEEFPSMKELVQVD